MLVANIGIIIPIITANTSTNTKIDINTTIQTDGKNIYGVLRETGSGELVSDVKLTVMVGDKIHRLTTDKHGQWSIGHTFSGDCKVTVTLASPHYKYNNFCNTINLY